MPTSLSSTNTLVGVTFSVTIPPDGNFGASAAMTVMLGTSYLGGTNFTPTSNRYSVTNAVIGTDTISFDTTYQGASSTVYGNITINSMTVTIAGQAPQTYSGPAFVWSGSGTMIIPSA